MELGFCIEAAFLSPRSFVLILGRESSGCLSRIEMHQAEYEYVCFDTGMSNLFSSDRSETL